MLMKIKNKITETWWRYKFSHSNVRTVTGSNVNIVPNTKISNSFVFVDSNSTLTIEEGVSISDCSITVINGGCLHIGKHCIIRQGRNVRKPEIIIDNGHASFSGHDLIQCDRVWVRFEGALSIGEYVNINAESEIRCDNSVIINGFTRCSYGVRIWDTNTHKVLSPEERCERTRKYFPKFGHEVGRPQTKPVVIGSGCWIGERAAVMKGSTIGNNVNIGFNTLVFGKTIEDGCSVVQDLGIKVFAPTITTDKK